MLEFGAQTSARFERAVRDHIKLREPGATVDFNYHGQSSVSLEGGSGPVLTRATATS